MTDTTRLRIVTLNMWGTHPPLEARLAVAARQLAELDPDAILLQEVRCDRNLGNTARTLVDAIGGPWHLHYEPAVRGAAGTWGPGSIEGEEGLAIATRLPVDETRVLELPDARPTERRILLSCRLGGLSRPLWLHTTHLHWRPRDEDARERQTRAISDAIRAIGEPAVIGGDFNAEPSAPSVRALVDDGFRDLFAEHAPGNDGFTWSERNPGTEPLGWLGANRRIDLLLAWSEPASALELADCRVALDEPADDGVFASDHFGLMADLAPRDSIFSRKPAAMSG